MSQEVPNIGKLVHDWLTGKRPGDQFTYHDALVGIQTSVPEGMRADGAVSTALSIFCTEGMLERVGKSGRAVMYQLIEVQERKFKPRRTFEIHRTAGARGQHSRPSVGLRQLGSPGLIESIGAVVAAAQGVTPNPERPKPLSERLLEFAIEVEAMERRLTVLEASDV